MEEKWDYVQVFSRKPGTSRAQIRWWLHFISMSFNWVYTMYSHGPSCVSYTHHASSAITMLFHWSENNFIPSFLSSSFSSWWVMTSSWPLRLYEGIKDKGQPLKSQHDLSWISTNNVVSSDNHILYFYRERTHWGFFSYIRHGDYLMTS